MFITTLIFGVNATNAVGITDSFVESEYTEELVAEALDKIDAGYEVLAEDLDNVNTGWLAGLWRNLQIFFVTDQIAKADLQLEKANIEMLKLQNQLAGNSDDSKIQERIQTATKKYNKSMEKIQERIEKYQEKKGDNGRVDAFMQKYTDHALKHQQIMLRIEKQVDQEVLEKITENRQKMLKTFNDVMTKLQEKEEFKSQLKNALEDGQVKFEHRMVRPELYSQMSKLDPETKKKIEELKNETNSIWTELEEAYGQVEENRLQLAEQIRNQVQQNKDNPEAVKELKNQIRQQVSEAVKENAQIRTEAKNTVQQFIKENEEELGEIRSELKAQKQGSAKTNLQVDTDN